MVLIAAAAISFSPLMAATKSIPLPFSVLRSTVHNQRGSIRVGAPKLSSETFGCITYSFRHLGSRDHGGRQEKGAFLQSSPYPIWNQSFCSDLGKPFHIPYACLGHNDGRQKEPEQFLGSPLPSHPRLLRGQLKNGLRYIVLFNERPPNSFIAHLEVHVGSIDEEDDEQGIAHMVEHVAFGGSKKLEELLLHTGAKAVADAATDFHHTVFYIEAQTSSKDSGDLILSALDALNEIAFNPKFLAPDVERERYRVLYELCMKRQKSTIKNLIHCQVVQSVHTENKLSRRFPIGLEDQIQKWDACKIQKFHERWYFPSNATLYLVGDIGNIPKAVDNIKAVFGWTVEENETDTIRTFSACGAIGRFLFPKLTGWTESRCSDRLSMSLDQMEPTKERQAVRSLIKHNWSLPGFGHNAVLPKIFQHDSIKDFTIRMICKIPVNALQTYGNWHNLLIKKIFLSALSRRAEKIKEGSNPPFKKIKMDHRDSGREGCTFITLQVIAEPEKWRDAVKVAFREVRRLKEFGLKKEELIFFIDKYTKMRGPMGSFDASKVIMESDACGHTVRDRSQIHKSSVEVAKILTLEEVNSTGAQVLEFISDFGKPTAPPPAAILTCSPKYIHIDNFFKYFKLSPQEIVDAMKEGLEEPIRMEVEE